MKPINKAEVIDVIDVTPLPQREGQDDIEYLEHLYHDEGTPLIEKVLRMHPLRPDKQKKTFLQKAFPWLFRQPIRRRS